MSTHADTITAGGTEFYIDDIVEVILKRMIPDAEEDENGTLHLTVTADDLLDQAVDYANDYPTELFSGSAFRRLGYGYEEDRSAGYSSVYDVPEQLAGNYEIEVEYGVYGERVTALRKVK